MDIIGIVLVTVKSDAKRGDNTEHGEKEDVVVLVRHSHDVVCCKVCEGLVVSMCVRGIYIGYTAGVVRRVFRIHRLGIFTTISIYTHLGVKQY